MTTENYQRHYNWVKKQISLLYPPGGSPRQIIEIAAKRRKEQQNSPYEFEKDTPGKHKIRKIIDEGKGVDWDYKQTLGGRGNISKIIPRSPDSGVFIEKSAHVVILSDIDSRLDKLLSKRNSRFSIDDYFEFVKIKNQLLKFPMNVYYSKIEKGLNRDVLFNSVVCLVRKKLDKLKKIEKAQKKVNQNFTEIIRNVVRLADIQADEAIFLPSVKNKELALILEEHFELGELFPIRNALRRLLRSK